MMLLEDLIINDAHKYTQNNGHKSIITIGVHTADEILMKYGYSAVDIVVGKISGKHSEFKGFKLELGDFKYGYLIGRIEV